MLDSMLDIELLESLLAIYMGVLCSIMPSFFELFLVFICLFLIYCICYIL